MGNSQVCWIYPCVCLSRDECYQATNLSKKVRGYQERIDELPLHYDRGSIIFWGCMALLRCDQFVSNQRD